MAAPASAARAAENSVQFAEKGLDKRSLNTQGSKMAHLQSPIALFLTQAVLIIAVSRGIGWIARRIGQPLVIAEILAGIVLGPSLLGLVAPQVLDAVFPKSSLAALNMLANVGLVLFMFLIGLELDPKLLRGKGRASVTISHASIVAPFGLGALAALVLYPRVSSPTVPFSSFVLFMGVAMSITAFPVLARILSERRLLQSKVGAITIACAAVDDVTAWCLLAFVVAIVRASRLLDAALTAVMAIGYIAAMVYVARPFLRRFGARAATRESVTQNTVAIVLILLFISSFATELIGIHALFGAFMLGAVMPKEGGFAQHLAEKLEDVVVVILLPIFFALSGLKTQIGLLNTPASWAMCALVIVVACVGKFGGGTLAARFTGMRWREAGALGILMNTRGLMELIVLNIGLELGVISPTLFTMMVIMALTTTFMTTPLLRLVYPPEELMKELADPDEPTPIVGVPRPFTVLMCVSYERTGPAMVTLAAALVERGVAKARVYALRLIRPSDRASAHVPHAELEEGGTLTSVLDTAAELGVTIKPLSFGSARPADDICNVADVKAADLILVGWHKPLLGSAVLSGTVHEVMNNAHSDVGVFIDRGLKRVERVLVPFQGSIHDKAALRIAERVASIAQGHVTILHVVAPTRGPNDPTLDARAQVQETFTSGAAGSVDFKVVEHSNASDAALDEARNSYDLVIIGAGHEWGLETRFFGIQPEKIIQGCPTSLLIVRQYQADRATSLSLAMKGKSNVASVPAPSP